jgi:hypothetical protein
LKTFRGRRASLLCQIHLGTWRLVPRWRSEAQWRSEASLLRFRRAPVVGVHIAEVTNTLVQWLRWMASSYVGHVDNKTTSSRSACRKYLGLAIPRYDYGPTNLVGHPGCVTFRGRCAFVALPACSGHLGFYIRNEGLLVRCVPDGPVKYLWVLWHFRLETSLRSACLEWLCQTLAAMQDIWVSLHSIHSRSTLFCKLHHRPTPNIATSTTT